MIEPANGWWPLERASREPIEMVGGITHVSNLPEEIPKRMKRAATRRLHAIAEVKIEERLYRGEEAIGQGGGIVLWAKAGRTILGASSLAERGKSSERVGEEAASELLAETESGATLDIHAADQLMIYLARASGPSHFIVRDKSGHLETMAWLLQQFVSCGIEIGPQGRGWNVSVEPRP
jgi:RNA 3'-terminal phosphate cyclase